MTIMADELKPDLRLYRAIQEPLIFPDDTARTRKTDRVTSHEAGDRSQKELDRVRAAVVEIVRQSGPIVGSEINRLYQARAGLRGWPLPLHFDSPRKRAGELAVDGVLGILNADRPRGKEAEYIYPEGGNAA